MNNAKLKRQSLRANIHKHRHKHNIANNYVHGLLRRQQCYRDAVLRGSGRPRTPPHQTLGVPQLDNNGSCVARLLACVRRV